MPDNSQRRFVILEHDHPFLHWDLMLEQGDTLNTWRLSAFPTTDTPIPAEPLPDHRLAYLDYEGPVSGDRGTVIRRVAGVFEVHHQTETAIHLSLDSDQLRGSASLLKNADNCGWMFTMKPTRSQSQSSS